MSGGQHLWRDHCQPRYQRPADDRSRPARQTGTGSHFKDTDQPHDGNADQRTDHPQQAVDQITGGVDRGATLDIDDIGHDAEALRGLRSGQRCSDDGGDRGGCVAADHDLEGIESARDRRTEGGRYRCPRASSDERPYVDPAQLQPTSDRRRDQAAELGIGCLQPDRRAETIGKNGLARDDGAVLGGHVAAVKRIGLDRIHERAPPRADQPIERRQYAAAEGKHENLLPVQRRRSAEPQLVGQAIEIVL